MPYRCLNSMNNVIFVVMTLALGGFVVGCGGGGGGGGNNTAPPPEGPINVSGLTRPATGSSLEAELAGTFSSGGQAVDANATLALSVGDETTFESQTVLPIDSMITIRIPSTGDNVTGGSTVFTTAGGSRIGENKDEGVTCSATSSTPLPQEVEVGDSGAVATLSCSDGSTQSQTYRVEAGNGTLNFVFVTEVDDGTSSLSELVTYRFTDDNEIASIRDEGSSRDNGQVVSFDLDGEVVASSL